MRRLLAGLCLSGCMHTLPRLPPPEPVLPQVAVPDGPPAQGSGRVLIDTSNGAARVDEQTGLSSRGDIFHTICLSTPCFADLPYGPHRIRFTALEDPTTNGVENMEVHGPTAYRYTMGHTRTHFLEMALGVLAIYFGPTATGIGTALVALKHEPCPGCIGAISGGLVTTALGVILLVLSKGETQSGNGVQWTP
jgi:hypothetical protein